MDTLTPAQEVPPPPVLLPPGRPWARFYTTTALGLVGRAFPLVQALDPEARRELEVLPPGFSFALRVHPHGPEARLRMGAKGRLSYVRGDSGTAPDVLMRFSTMRSALSVLGFSSSAFEIYARGGLAVSGDLGATMAIIRALGVVETVLLPGFIARRVLKRPARIPFGRLLGERLATYVSLPFAGASKERV